MASKTNTILKNQSGAALVIALIMMVVITLIALTSSYTSIFEITISGNKRGATNAFYAADAGVNAITSYISNFDLSKYSPDTDPTLKTYNPFSDASILNPTNISPSAAPIKYYQTQSGPPRGGGFSAVSVAYAYYQVQCTGSDTVGSGATSQIREDVMRLLPVQ
jgi:Tfp pilus assembly protein PilX